MESLKKMVATCLDSMDPCLGNISHIIAAELNSPIADRERALLPKEQVDKRSLISLVFLIVNRIITATISMLYSISVTNAGPCLQL